MEKEQFRIGGCYRTGDGRILRLERCVHADGQAESIEVHTGTYSGLRNLSDGRFWVYAQDTLCQSHLIPGELYEAAPHDWRPVEAGVRDFGAIKPQPAADDDGWITWGGGECPVPGAMTEVRLRGGIEWTGHHAQHGERWFWGHHHGSTDIIVAYRVLSQEPAKAEPQKLVDIEGALDALNAEMIRKDGPAKPKAPKPAPEPVSTTKPALVGLLTEHQMGHRFGLGR